MSLRAILHSPVARGAALGVACALFTWALARYPLLQGLEDWALDGCFIARGPRPSPSRAKIVVVGLDDASLDALGKPLVAVSPELAEVVTCLHRQGAAAIGLDLMVPQAMTGWPELGARQVGDAVEDAGSVVLPEWRLGPGNWLRPVDQWQLKYLTRPRRVLRGLATTDLGFVDLSPDPDNCLRRQQLVAADLDDCLRRKQQAAGVECAHLQFALALLSVARNLPVDYDAEGGLRVGGARVPLEDDGKLRVNFAGPPGTFEPVSFRAVLAAARGQGAPPGGLRGAIVIVGMTAATEQDYHSNPYANDFFGRLFQARSHLMSGPEFHANVLATLADGAYITTPPWLSNLPVLLLTGVLLGIAYTRLRLLWGLGLMVAHHFAWKGVCLWAFAAQSWRVDVVPPLLLGVLAYGCAFVLRWRWQRRMMAVVKSEPIASALEADPARLLRGEEREVTVLFSDIRGFTTFSEGQPPQAVVHFLNAYFDAVVPVIERHGGVLNQYMGDGMMVLFGAPFPQPDHAARAVRAGVDIVRRVHELQDRWAQAGKPGMRVGVGIHTGPAVAGMVGARNRLDYSAIGDTVNTASRIESENKKQNTEILISAQTWQAISPADRQGIMRAAEPVPVQVPGKSEPLLLYTVHVPS